MQIKARCLLIGSIFGLENSIIMTYIAYTTAASISKFVNGVFATVDEFFNQEGVVEYLHTQTSKAHYGQYDTFMEGVAVALPRLRHRFADGGFTTAELISVAVTAIKNGCHDAHRRNTADKRQALGGALSLSTPIGDGNNTVADLLGDSDPSYNPERDYCRLIPLLRGMRAKAFHKAVFWLYAEGYKMEEIAAFTGSTVSTVKPIIHRMKKKLGIK